MTLAFDEPRIQEVVGSLNRKMLVGGEWVDAASGKTFDSINLEESVYDEAVEGVSEAARNIKVGNGLDETTQMGPLVSSEQFDRVTGYINSGKDEGASILGGDRVGDTVITDLG